MLILYLNKYNNYQNIITELNKVVKSLNSDNDDLKNDVVNLNIEIQKWGVQNSFKSSSTPKT